MTFRIALDKPQAAKFRANLAGIGDRVENALRAAANMAAALIEERAKADIAGAGFGGSWVSGLHVTVDGGLKNMRISMEHDDPRVGIFETGGRIEGNPLLWIPISGTDAAHVRARDFGGGLKSGHPKGHPPLLFSQSDGMPKYFGVESVTVPKKFRLREIQTSVMENFRFYYLTEFVKAG